MQQKNIVVLRTAKCEAFLSSHCSKNQVLEGQFQECRDVVLSRHFGKPNTIHSDYIYVEKIQRVITIGDVIYYLLNLTACSEGPSELGLFAWQKGAELSVKDGTWH